MAGTCIKSLTGWKLLTHLLCRSGYQVNSCPFVSKNVLRSVFVSANQRTLLKDNHSQFICRRFNKSASICLKKNTSTGENSDLDGKRKSEHVGLVLLFDSNDLFIGKMTKTKAQDLAKQDNLKLVLLKGEKTEVPSYKLMTGKELFEDEIRQKKDRKSEKPKEDKKFKLTTMITDHDLGIKLKHAREALEDGSVVRFQLTSHRRTSEEEGAVMQNNLFKKITKEFTDIAEIKQARKTPKDMTFELRQKRTGAV
ncbi:hypothetical protein ScPMuIL_011390 [Solemya velum]